MSKTNKNIVKYYLLDEDQHLYIVHRCTETDVFLLLLKKEIRKTDFVLFYKILIVRPFLLLSFMIAMVYQEFHSNLYEQVLQE